MHPFTFTHVNDSKTAVKELQLNKNAKLIGGGTNLTDLMKMYVETPDRIIDINALNENKIEILPSGMVHIGALVKNSDLAYHPYIQSKYPVLTQALLSGASPQLRNMATVGGNLMQRTRCPYFFDISFPCNKRSPGSGCSAISGYNRTHAVLGTSDKCIAVHPSDMCVALATLDATILVEGPNGKRSIPFTEFHLEPGLTPNKETVMDHDEIITAIELPALPYSKRSVYVKIRDRNSFEFALASAAVILNANNGIINNVKMAMGGVGTKPWRCFEAEKFITTKQLSLKTYEEAAEITFKSAQMFKYNSFKVELGKRALIRALTIAGGLS
jgi:xanthine dehydrogenase YagS FAD-binding subunit